MRLLLAFVFVFAAGAGRLKAQQAGNFGAGLVLGSPTGITGKLWLDDGHALVGGVGLDSDISLSGDFLWNSWTIFPQPSKGRLPAYLGLGVQVGSAHNNDSGLRGIAGLAYWLPHDPLEIFFELVPVFHSTHGIHSDLNANLGLRYYFK